MEISPCPNESLAKYMGHGIIMSTQLCMSGTLHIPHPHTSTPSSHTGAKLFYLSGMRHGKYLKREILNLARFISVMKFRPLSWRMEHPFLVADR